MKKAFAIMLVLTLLISLAACGGDGGGGGGDGGGGGTTAPPANEDPCPCCPECVQKECVCEECGDNDEYDCICAAPDVGGSWTISFIDVTDSAPQVGAEGMFAQDITLSFEASNLSVGDFSGQYSGEGKMMGVQDSSGYEAMAGGLIEVNSDWSGPILPVTFEVIDSSSGTPNDDSESLTPGDLNEELKGYAKFSAVVDGTMGTSWYQENVLGSGMTLNEGAEFTLNVEMHILVYDGGTAILYMTVPGLSGTLMYRGTFTR